MKFYLNGILFGKKLNMKLKSINCSMDDDIDFNQESFHWKQYLKVIMVRISLKIFFFNYFWYEKKNEIVKEIEIALRAKENERVTTKKSENNKTKLNEKKKKRERKIKSFDKLAVRLRIYE